MDLMQTDKIDGSYLVSLDFYKVSYKMVLGSAKDFQFRSTYIHCEENRRKMSYEKISCTVSCLSDVPVSGRLRR